MNVRLVNSSTHRCNVRLAPPAALAALALLLMTALTVCKIITFWITSVFLYVLMATTLQAENAILVLLTA